MARYSRVDGILFETRENGETVIDGLKETMDTYGTVSVADLYDLCGLVCNYKDNKYGWTDVSSAKIVVDGNLYLLQIDEPIMFK